MKFVVWICLVLPLCTWHLAGFCSAQTPVNDPPDAWEAVQKLLTAYAYVQSNCETVGSNREYTVEIDADGSTDWYRQNFQTGNYIPLARGYSTQLASPQMGNATVTPTRTSTLLCPYRPFTYYCELDGANVQTTATSSTKSKQYSVGRALTVKASFGVEVFGNGGSVTGSITAGYSYNHKTDSIDTNSDTKTETISQYVTMDPKDGVCNIAIAQLGSLTVSGTMQVQAVLKGYVGFKVNKPVYWGSDNTYTDLRAQSIATIVNASRNLQCGDFFNRALAEVDGFQTVSVPSGEDYVIYSNSYQLDYFQGSEATSYVQSQLNTSDYCINKKPPGFENITWPAAAPAATGRHLLGGVQRTSVRSEKPLITARLASNPETTYTLTPTGGLEAAPEAGNRGQLVNSRRLLKTDSTNSTTRVKDTCPKIAYVAYKTVKNATKALGVREVTAPGCYGTGLKSYVKNRQAIAQMKKVLRQQCFVSLEGQYDTPPPNITSSSSLQLPVAIGVFSPTLLRVHQSGKQCRFKATNSRIASQPLPQAPGPETLETKINRLFNGICFFQTGRDCDGIDYSNAYSAQTYSDRGTDLWSDPAIPPATVTLGMTAPDFNNTELETETLIAKCEIDASSPSLCQTSATDLTTKSTTTATTSTHTLTMQLGVSVKTEVNVLGAKTSLEVGSTNTFTYSWITGESKTDSDGQLTTALIKVPIPPGNCVETQVYINKVKGGGALDAYACVEGLVQVLQVSTRPQFAVCVYDATNGQCNRYPYIFYDKPNNICLGASSDCWLKGVNGGPDSNSTLGYSCEDPDGCSAAKLGQPWARPSAMRAISMAWAVNHVIENDLELAGSTEWYIDDKGRACLKNTIAVSFAQGVVATVDPQIYPLDSDVCKSINVTTNTP